jgi:hypothetical protein
MLEVMRARFREELDYAHEAESLRAFGRLHAGDPTVRIPALVDDCCGARVLTTELARGASFEQACAAPEAERRAWAQTMWRFVFKGTLVGGLLNADPHPGNYVFQEDGRVTFLDFGCIQSFAERRPFAVRIHRAAIARDEAEFARGVAVMIASKPGPLEDLAIAYTRRCFEPLFGSPYRITKGYAASMAAVRLLLGARPAGRRLRLRLGRARVHPAGLTPQRRRGLRIRMAPPPSKGWGSNGGSASTRRSMRGRASRIARSARSSSKAPENTTTSR